MVRAQLGILAAVGLTASASADVLSDHDNGPLAGIFGLPDSAEGAELVEAGEMVWGATLLTASHSVADASPGELLILDGETTRLGLRMRRGFGGAWEFGIEVPYLTHQAGGLDSVIDQWHDFFGLPDGSRDTRPRDVLEYSYRDGNALLLNVRRSANGFGDLRLLGAYQLQKDVKRVSALRFSAKLPTGDSADLLGSGGVDLSAGIAGDYLGFGRSERWSGFYRANVTFLGEPDILADRYEEWVWQLAGGLSYRLTPRFTLDVQGLIRSALYDTDVAALGEAAVALTFGTRIRLTDRWELALGVGEDIKVESVPDVTFQIGLRLTP